MEIQELTTIKSLADAKKAIEKLQLTANQDNPSDERGAGYKLGTLNACNIALESVEQAETEILRQIDEEITKYINTGSGLPYINGLEFARKLIKAKSK